MMDAHENSVGGSQMQVGQIAILQAALKFDPAVNDARVLHRKPQRGQFPVTKLFSPRSGSGKI